MISSGISFKSTLLSNTSLTDFFSLDMNSSLSCITEQLNKLSAFTRRTYPGGNTWTSEKNQLGNNFIFTFKIHDLSLSRIFIVLTLKKFKVVYNTLIQLSSPIKKIIKTQEVKR